MSVISVDRRTEAAWNADSVVHPYGYVMVEISAISGQPDKIKIGNGVSLFSALPYLTDGSKGMPIASATTVNLGQVKEDSVNITGNVTINSFGTAVIGARKKVTFTGSATLAYNSTSMILPTSADIVATSGDTAEFESLGGSNWKCLWYYRFSGVALASSGGGGIPEPTSDGSYLRDKNGLTFSWVSGIKKAGDTMTGRLNLASSTDIASASTTDLSTATGNSVLITGTTTINSFGTVTAGAMIWLMFDSVLTISNNSNIILWNSEDIITSRDDQALFVSRGSGVWQLASYIRADGMPANRRLNKFFVRGHIINAFGSSHFVGTGSTSADRGVINQFKETSGCVINNKAVSGAGILQVIKQACTTASYLYSVDQIFDCLAEAGFNDAIRTLGNPRSGFTSASNYNQRTYDKIEDGWTTFIANYFTKSATPVSSGTITKTGTWTTQSASGAYPSKAELNLSGNGMYSTTSGDKITYTMSAGNGRRLAIWLVTNDQALSGETFGSVNVTLNGTTVHSGISLNDRTIGTSDWVIGDYNNNYGVKCLLVDTYGSSVSTNIIEVVHAGGGKVIIDSILELKKSAKAPQMLVSLIPFLNTTGYTLRSDGVTLRDYVASDTFFSIANSYIRRATNLFPEYNIVVVDPNEYIRDSNLSSDNVHFNDVGHKNWNKALMQSCSYDTCDSASIRLSLTATPASVADSTQYYYTDTVGGISNSEGSRRYYFARAFKVESIRVTINGVAGTSENSSIFLDKNGALASTVTTTVNLSTLSASVQFIAYKYDVDVTFEAGDYCSGRWATPAWATNPSSIMSTMELIGKYV